MSELNTGTLTPRSNDKVDAMRFAGDFGQPDGFSSVLDVWINCAGDACFTLTWRNQIAGEPNSSSNQWSVMLTEQQRNALGAMLCRYQTRTYERYDPGGERE